MPDRVRIVRTAGIVLALAILAGCASRGAGLSSSVDYGASKVVAPLDVPPDLTRPRVDDRFTVPGDQAAEPGGSGAGQSRAAAAGGPASPARVLPAVSGVTLERDGAQRWLRIDRPAEAVWPAVREFWQEAGFIIANESERTGIIDTDWAENRAQISQGFLRNSLRRIFGTFYSTGERDRYRTRLERNADGSTNLFVTHRGMVEVYADRLNENTRWQPRPSDPSLEAEFLRLLMLRFGGEPPAALQAQAAAAGTPQAAPGQPGASQSASDTVARISGEGADRRLLVNDGFDRAWRRVGLALDRTGFTVEDRDRSQGTYYVRYIDSENPQQREPGAIAKFFGAESPEPSLQAYRIIVAAAPDSAARSLVRVAPRDDNAVFNDDSAATAQRMLGLIAEQLDR